MRPSIWDRPGNHHCPSVENAIVAVALNDAAKYETKLHIHSMAHSAIVLFSVLFADITCDVLLCHVTWAEVVT